MSIEDGRAACRWHQWVEWLCSIEGSQSDVLNALVHKYEHAKTAVKPQSDNLKTLDPLMFNPLAKTVNNPWTSVHKDTELLEEINKDVTRTFQEIPVFQTRETQSMLSSVLFTWCKKEKLGYRQGLNDLAGIFVFACSEGGLCSEQLEAVVFGLFQSLLAFEDVRKMFYNAVEGQNFTLDRCEKVFDEILPKHDRELHRHLATVVEVAPALFLLRWLRLLFIREFPINMILIMWDALFRDVHYHHDFALADFLAVAMMRAVRADLLKSDNSNCLRRLLKYPNVKDNGARLITDALEMRDGKPSVRGRGSSQAFLVADEDDKPSQKTISTPTAVHNNQAVFADPLASMTASVTAITQSLMPMAAPVLNSISSFLPGQYFDDRVTDTLSEVVASLERSNARHEIESEIVKLNDLLAIMRK